MSPSCPPLEAETNMLQLKLQIAFLFLPKRSLPTQLGPLRKKIKTTSLLHIKHITSQKMAGIYQGVLYGQRHTNLGSVIQDAFDHILDHPPLRSTAWAQSPSSILSQLELEHSLRWNHIVIHNSADSLIRL